MAKNVELRIFPLIIAVIMLSLIGESGAISCYTCSSRNFTDSHCHDPYNPAFSTYTQDCMVPKKGHTGRFPANFCLKVKGVTVDTDEELIIRACSLENMDSQCGVFKFEDDTLRGCILTCEFDGCNGAQVTTTTARGAAAIIAAAILLIILAI